MNRAYRRANASKKKSSSQKIYSPTKYINKNYNKFIVENTERITDG
tara:strand:+ start:749 stop:886 length:138 start_codon:yes stop_codon:yes gene_type:complete